jgi:hypothetical protein
VPRVLCLLPGRYSETICMTLGQWLRIGGRAEVRKGCTLRSRKVVPCSVNRLVGRTPPVVYICANWPYCTYILIVLYNRPTSKSVENICC